MSEVSTRQCDARGRIMVGDPNWGHLCECGNLKGLQAIRCRECYREGFRDDAYWTRRTCPDCGGPKTRDSRWLRCRRCSNARRIGVVGIGRRQPEGHPWRRRLAA